MIVRTVGKAAELLAPFFASGESEALAVIHLDGGQRLLALTFEEGGTERDVELPVGSILAKALKVGARAIIIAHNHPSGDPAPSAADEEATRLLARAAAAVEVRLHDHLIFGGGSLHSFRSLGLL